MARYPLKKETADFAEKAAAMIGTKGWQGRFAKLWHSYRERFAERTPATRKLYTSKFRKALEERLPEDWTDEQVSAVLSRVDFEGGLIESLRKQYKESVSARNRELKCVKDYKAYVRLFADLLDNDNPRLKALALLAVTGRRFYEICVTAEFKPVTMARDGAKARLKYRVDFAGQAKTRGADGTQSGKIYRIPCLAPSDKVIAALASLRADDLGQVWSDLELSQLNSRESGYMNKMLRALLDSSDLDEPEIKDGFTVSDLRSIYAEIAHHVFAQPSETQGAYFARILGHAENDHYTSISYMNYYLGDSVEAEIRVRKAIEAALDGEAAREGARPSQGGSDDVAVIE